MLNIFELKWVLLLILMDKKWVLWSPHSHKAAAAKIIAEQNGYQLLLTDNEYLEKHARKVGLLVCKGPKKGEFYYLQPDKPQAV